MMPNPNKIEAHLKSSEDLKSLLETPTITHPIISILKNKQREADQTGNLLIGTGEQSKYVPIQAGFAEVIGATESVIGIINFVELLKQALTADNREASITKLKELFEKFSVDNLLGKREELIKNIPIIEAYLAALETREFIAPETEEQVGEILAKFAEEDQEEFRTRAEKLNDILAEILAIFTEHWDIISKWAILQESKERALKSTYYEAQKTSAPKERKSRKLKQRIAAIIAIALTGGSLTFSFGEASAAEAQGGDEKGWSETLEQFQQQTMAGIGNLEASIQAAEQLLQQLRSLIQKETNLGVEEHPSREILDNKYGDDNETAMPGGAQAPDRMPAQFTEDLPSREGEAGQNAEGEGIIFTVPAATLKYEEQFTLFELIPEENLSEEKIILSQEFTVTNGQHNLDLSFIEDGSQADTNLKSLLSQLNSYHPYDLENSTDMDIETSGPYNYELLVGVEKGQEYKVVFAIKNNYDARFGDVILPTGSIVCIDSEGKPHWLGNDEEFDSVSLISTDEIRAHFPDIEEGFTIIGKRNNKPVIAITDEEAVSVPESITTITVESNVNIREEAGLNAKDIGDAVPGISYVATAKPPVEVDEHTWTEIEFVDPNTGEIRTGWIASSLSTVTVTTTPTPELTGSQSNPVRLINEVIEEEITQQQGEFNPTPTTPPTAEPDFGQTPAPEAPTQVPPQEDGQEGIAVAEAGGLEAAEERAVTATVESALIKEGEGRVSQTIDNAQVSVFDSESFREKYPNPEDTENILLEDPEVVQRFKHIYLQEAVKKFTGETPSLAEITANPEKYLKMVGDEVLFNSDGSSIRVEGEGNATTVREIYENRIYIYRVAENFEGTGKNSACVEFKIINKRVVCIVYWPDVGEKTYLDALGDGVTAQMYSFLGGIFANIYDNTGFDSQRTDDQVFHLLGSYYTG